MDKRELFNAIANSVDGLTSCWLFKTIGAFFVAAICNMHVQLLTAFAAIVVLDLFTKWLALAKQFLTDRGVGDTNLWDCMKALRSARRAGYIKSSEMKHRFAGKIAVYMMLSLAAALGDLLMLLMNKPEYLVVLVVGYLAVTELMSIVENLQGAGVEEMGKLRDIIDQKGRSRL